VTGAYAYVFSSSVNGTIACSVDRDCPASSVCSVNPTAWVSALPSGMCTCYMPSALVGELCQTLTSQSLGIMAGYSIATVLALATLILCIGLLGLLFFSLEVRTFNPLVVTLMFCTVGAVCLSVYTIIEVSSFNHASVTVFPDGHKDTSVSVAQFVFSLSLLRCVYIFCQKSIYSPINIKLNVY